MFVLGRSTLKGENFGMIFCFCENCELSCYWADAHMNKCLICAVCVGAIRCLTDTVVGIG